MLKNGIIITLFSFWNVENNVEFVEKPHLWHNVQKRILAAFIEGDRIEVDT